MLISVSKLLAWKYAWLWRVNKVHLLWLPFAGVNFLPNGLLEIIIFYLGQHVFYRARVKVLFYGTVATKKKIMHNDFCIKVLSTEDSVVT